MKRLDLLLYAILFLAPIVIGLFVPINSLDKGYVGTPKPFLSIGALKNADAFKILIVSFYLLMCIVLPSLVYALKTSTNFSWAALVPLSLFVLAAAPLLLLAFSIHEKSLISNTQIYSMNIWGYLLVFWCIGTLSTNFYLVIKKAFF